MFQIGEFSRFSRVSVRMLRHYDELNLLKPARVDPQSGYRYYTADQLPRLNRILALRDIGFPLEQIGGLLEEDLSAGELRGMLKLRQAELETELEAGMTRLSQIEARLEQIEGGGAAAEYDVVLRSVDPIRIASIRSSAPDTESITDLFEGLEAYVAEHRARASSPPLTIYHDTEHPELAWDIEVAVPIDRDIPETERIGAGQLPAVPNMACVVHSGSYSRIHLASNALLSFTAANDYRASGPSREVYLRFGAGQVGYQLPSAYLARHSDEFVTELQLPVEPVQERSKKWPTML